MHIMERQKQYRFQLLKKIYEVTNGDSRIPANAKELCDTIDIPSGESNKVVTYLIHEGLLKARALGGFVIITHYGIKEIEQALSEPESPTQHFPAMSNVLIVENMTGSLIQQGTSGSTATLNFTGNTWNDVSSLTKQLKDNLERLGLENDQKKELASEIQTVEVQLASPKPKSGIVREAFKSVRTILEGAAGNVIASGLLGQLKQLMDSFS